MQAHQANSSWMSYALTLFMIAVVMALRLRKMGQMRPLKLGGLFVVPILYLVVAAIMFVQLPPTGWVAMACVATLLIGAAVGWQRGKMMHIEVDPEALTLNQRASPAAMFFLIGLVIVRMGARAILGQGSDVSPAMLTDPLIGFALGMFTLQRVESVLAGCLMRRAAAPDGR